MFGFIDFGFIDIADMFFVALLLYQVYRVVRGTGVMAIFGGIFVIYLSWVLVRALDMELLSSLLGQVIGIGALALVVVFQQEIRRYLLMLGRRGSGGFWHKLFVGRSFSMDSSAIDEVYEACVSMSGSRTGALIVLERSTDLDVYMSSGDKIGGVISRRLLESIFYKNSPLHDGAVIVSDGRIAAARCILPASDSVNLPAHMGLRHRAALGISENSDAVVIVVSEETGRVSVVKNGFITTLLKIEDLRDIMGQKTTSEE